MSFNHHLLERTRRYGAFLKTTLKMNTRSLQVVTGLFLAGLVCGAFENPALTSFVNALITGLMARFQDSHGVELFIRIFLNNFSAALIVTLAGIVLGLFPLASAFCNGLLLGAVLFNVGATTHWNFFQRILSVVPHGTFELPAFFLALSLGVRLGTWPFRKEKRLFIKSLFNEGSGIFFKIILPFLIIAAAIETTGIEMLR